MSTSNKTQNAVKYYSVTYLDQKGEKHSPFVSSEDLIDLDAWASFQREFCKYGIIKRSEEDYDIKCILGVEEIKLPKHNYVAQRLKYLNELTNPNNFSFFSTDTYLDEEKCLELEDPDYWTEPYTYLELIENIAKEIKQAIYEYSEYHEAVDSIERLDKDREERLKLIKKAS